MNPPGDIKGRFTNVHDEDRKARRRTWVQDALNAGLMPKQIAGKLGINPTCVYDLIRNADLQRPKAPVIPYRHARLFEQGIDLGKGGTGGIFDELPRAAQDRVMDRAARTGKTVRQIFTEDLQAFYNEQRRG